MSFELGDALLDHVDAWWASYRSRLDGLSDHENLWSPVKGLTVREVAGRWSVDPVDREADPPPFTSVAWRMWHIAVDCVDSYAVRAFGSAGSGLAEDEWVGTAAEAIAVTDAAWAHFRGAFSELDRAGFERTLGDDFGRFGDRSYAALALHAQAEFTHHGAEIGLLRDLYRLR